MDLDATDPPTLPKRPRRDAVTWVLTAVTAAVLLVGVLVIRSTRSEPPRRPQDHSTAAAGSLAPLDATPNTPPRVIVAMPEAAPDEPEPTPKLLPSTAGRPGVRPTDRR